MFLCGRLKSRFRFSAPATSPDEWRWDVIPWRHIFDESLPSELDQLTPTMKNNPDVLRSRHDHLEPSTIVIVDLTRSYDKVFTPTVRHDRLCPTLNCTNKYLYILVAGGSRYARFVTPDERWMESSCDSRIGEPLRFKAACNAMSIPGVALVIGCAYKDFKCQ